jgi:hypothetical protein
MKKIINVTLFVFLTTSTLMASQNPKELFEQKCAICHSMTKPKDMSSVVAPAIMGVMRHVKMNFNNKAEAVAFMKDYVLNPSVKKAICQKRKIERFGLMPSQKGVVSESELDIILPWVYDTYPPKGFRGNGRRGIR